MGPCVKVFLDDVAKDAAEKAPQSLFDAQVESQQRWEQKLLAARGSENPYALHKELGKSMSDNVTIIRVNKKLNETLSLVRNLKDRYQNNLGMPDGSLWTNQSLTFTKALRDMIALSEAITMAAIAREESRGAHFKVPDHLAERHDISLEERSLKRDDENWLKTTLVTCQGGAPDKFGTPLLSYEKVDISLVQPVARSYGKTVPPSPAPAPAKAPAPEPVVMAK
jgi:succinate dehydrogenase / fumarate reductase flavoprotein subunit